MPVRIWDTFVSDGNTFGMGMLYATDNGASVIEGANGSTYHSAFAEQASRYAYDHGVMKTYSGDDLITGDNTTQYGGKSSISMEGTTGSENTGKAAGAAGLVVSAARDANPQVNLRPDETREILEQTAERVTTGNTTGLGTPDPAASPTAPREDQWTPHFGWGRANLGAAVALAHSGQIPPQAAIDSPDWYAPLTGSSVDIRGL